MSYVVVKTKHHIATAEKLREYLLAAEQHMPPAVLHTEVHVWLAHQARLIDDKARRARDLSDSPETV